MYVDALLNKKTDTIHLAERIDGQRILRKIPASYVFYYEDASGSHRSIFGHACARYSTTKQQQFRLKLDEKRQRGRRIFESDVNPVYRALADQYLGAEAPRLHVGFFDIEVGFDAQRGFAPPNDPFSPITAISLYRSYDEKLLSFVLKPPGLPLDEAEAIVAASEDCQLFTDETALLMAFLEAVEDIDCFTGWNSSSYDIAYLINRLRRLVNIDSTRRLCLWDQLPTARQYKNKFGRMVDTYDLHGRVHLDYLDLYAKHNPQQRLSYRLDYIGEIEVGETKVPYEGTLDTLYNKEFAKFIRYNRQDVLLMVKIDDKLKFIELANQIAHANCVLLKTTMGSVAFIEQAIINEMHAMGCVVPDRPREVEEDAPDNADLDDDEQPDDATPEGHTPVVGAYVAQPKTGLHEHIGCVDINSLYPSAIRALNMSPETLIGQVRTDETMALVEERAAKLTKTQRAEAWDGLFCTCEVQHMHDRDDTLLKVDFFDHLHDTVTTKTMTGWQLHDYVFNPANHVCISANGTIFDTAKEGMISALLGKWYAERKALQAQQRAWESKRDQATTEEARIEAIGWAEFYNQRQQAAKIRLNATYGTLLNQSFRMYDDRLGQSTTLTGRTIVRHMNAKINEIITGQYDYRGAAIVYADTDSAYFSAYEVLRDQPDFQDVDWTRETIIKLYDGIAEMANKTFPAFMQATFNTNAERAAIINAGRELIASKGLYIKKKKYAVLMYDKEGHRLDTDGKPGKLKPMGLDLKRADTPKVMQQFLEKLLMDLLTGVAQQQMFDDIKAFRQSFKTRPGWEKGTPKKAGNLSQFADMQAAASQKGLTVGRALRRSEKLKVSMPGHVLASLNWNRLCEVNHDRYVTQIGDSTRIIVCKLRRNPMGMTSIAYPMDEPHLPAWFRELPFDHEAMEETIIDNKILNLVSVLHWDLRLTKILTGEGAISWS